MPAFHSPICRALGAAILALRLGGPAWAGVCAEDFEGAPDCGYRVTIVGGDEYASVDPAVAGAGATTTFTLRVEYDAALAELTTLYRMDDGPFVVYPLLDGAGDPAPVLDPLADWMLAPDDAIEVYLLFAATRAAAFGDEPHTVTASFDLLAGDVAVDDLTVSGTLVPLPEPPAPASLGAGLLGLLLLRRARPSQA